MKDQKAGHQCSAIVITCIDFRIQKHINDFLKKKFPAGKYHFDRVALAGGIFDFYSVLRQVEISSHLHQIKKVIMINHEDCGAYGREGSFSRHKKDLLQAEKKIKILFPKLDVEVYYLYLDGHFLRLSKKKTYAKK